MRTPSHLTIISLLLASPWPTTARAGDLAPGPAVHQVTASPQGLSVNGYLVEGRRSVVAVDSALTVSDSKALRARLDAIGKPLVAVLITHGHPDHYNGVAYLIEGRSVPVYATAAVTQVIRDWDERKERQWKPVFKEEWPPHRVFPDHVLRSGQKVRFDELEFVVRDLGPAESHADSYWELLGPERSAFIGDEVLAGSHAYTNDGHTAEWIRNLDVLARALKGVEHVYPGHGPAGDASLFEWERRYLVAYRREVEELRHGRDTLSDEQKSTLVARMKSAYPSAGNEFMIALGADTVAAELAKAHGGK
jgi:glyoxylase-like metal-dependent hydrolase (beta-lactamase superfamily II)